MECRRIATLPVMAALCIGIQLAPRPPNVEFTSLICFLTGFLFGAPFGALLGALTMFINGFLSPWGFAGIIMPFQMLGMALIGFAGGAYRKLLGNDFSIPKSLDFESACLAAFLTLIYDIITNVGYAALFNLEIVVVLITGVWLSIIHVVSNTVLFWAAFHRLIKIVGSLAGENL